MPYPTREELIMRKVLKRPQTLQEIAERIAPGTKQKSLTHAVGTLLREGRVQSHPGRPARYSKV